ncbi:hypothetical protein D6V26_20360 [Vibrio cholerae]|nr:hypothetical protein [Vibrio cholerae]
MNKRLTIAALIFFTASASALNKKDIDYITVNNFEFHGITKKGLKQLDLPVVDNVRKTHIKDLKDTSYISNIPDDAIVITDRDYTYLRVIAQYQDKKTCVDKAYNPVLRKQVYRSYGCKLITDNEGTYGYKKLKATRLRNGSAEYADCPFIMDSDNSMKANFNPYKKYYMPTKQPIYGDVQSSISCDVNGVMNYTLTDVYRNSEIEFKELRSLKFDGLKLSDDTKVDTDNKTYIKIDSKYDKVEDCDTQYFQYFFNKYEKYQSSCNVNESWDNGCDVEINKERIEMKFNPNRFDRKITGDVGDWYLKAECKGNTLKIESKQL